MAFKTTFYAVILMPEFRYWILKSPTIATGILAIANVDHLKSF